MYCSFLKISIDILPRTRTMKTVMAGKSTQKYLCNLENATFCITSATPTPTPTATITIIIIIFNIFAPDVWYAILGDQESTNLFRTFFCTWISLSSTLARDLLFLWSYIHIDNMPILFFSCVQRWCMGIIDNNSVEF